MVYIFKFNENIFSLTKHGTRYCTENIGHPEVKRFSFEYIESQIKTPKTKIFIVRNPEEYFYSALRTELTHEFNHNVPENGYDTQSIKEKFDYILGRMYYCDKDCYGPHHYIKNAYRIIYTFRDYVNFIDLKKLSLLVTIMKDYNFIDNYNKQDFAHLEKDYNISNEFIKDMLKNEHKEFYNKFIIEIEKELEIYNQLNIVDPNITNIREILNPLANRTLL